MSLMRSALAVLRDWRRTHSANSVQYIRGIDIHPVPATQARTTATKDDGVTIIKTYTEDWLIAVVDFPKGLGEPQLGDRIQFDGKTWEVVDANGENCWRYHESSHLTFRVHTVLVP